ncbi:MAG: response regulator [Candidatus Omnitrophota bacterium]
MAKRILIVEDEPDQREVLKFRLEQNGYEVILACDGEEGLLKAQTEHPDLVLLDIMLPKMDGFEVCRRLKQDKNTAAIPIMGLTAFSQKSTEEKVRAAGSNDFMSKLSDSSELLARIKRLIGG